VKSISLKIHGMDCAEEVAVLKREVGPVAGGVERLVFDLINGRLTIVDPPATVDTRTIREAVGRTGMKAVDWDEHVAATRTGRSTGRSAR
jgi:Cd2+/Zn2+-exporting ATPase